MWGEERWRPRLAVGCVVGGVLGLCEGERWIPSRAAESGLPRLIGGIPLRSHNCFNAGSKVPGKQRL